MKKLTLLAMTALMTGTAALGAVPRDFSRQLDSILETRYKSANEPGAAVIVAVGDSVIYERYMGVADMKSGEKISEKTLFNIASISKQFTVVGLLRLVDQGLVSMDDPVSKYMDYKEPFWRGITLADLAGHTSGIPDNRDRSSREKCVYATDETSIQYFDRVTASDLEFKAGAAYDYLNPSFLILAKVIEKLSDESFVDYQRRHVFRPSGMDNAVYFSPEKMPPHTAHGYIPDDRGGWREYDYGEETFFATRPDGGVYATARDMLAWEKSLDRCTVITAESRNRAYTPRVDVSSSKWCDYQRRPYTSYGLGWFIDRNPDYPVKVYHTGDNGGFQAFLSKTPEAVRVIILENRNDNPRWTLVRQIDDLLQSKK
jgi:CubicO group peptidase (beta-lactamase class C family)